MSVVLRGTSKSYGAIKATGVGVAMLYQELAWFDDKPVVHSIFFGYEITNAFGFLRYRAMRTHAQEIVNGFSVRPFDVRMPAGHLSGGQRQVSALARTTAFGSRYIILDELTFARSPGARDEVLNIVRKLADSGIGIVMVSHDPGHVRKVCDRVHTLYLGGVANARDMATTTQAEIISLVVQGHSGTDCNRL